MFIFFSCTQSRPEVLLFSASSFPRDTRLLAEWEDWFDIITHSGFQMLPQQTPTFYLGRRRYFCLSVLCESHKNMTGSHVLAFWRECEVVCRINERLHDSCLIRWGVEFCLRHLLKVRWVIVFFFFFASAGSAMFYFKLLEWCCDARLQQFSWMSGLFTKPRIAAVTTSEGWNSEFINTSGAGIRHA